MRLPEKCFEREIGAWKFGVTLCFGTWAVIIWWDGNPYSLAVVFPLVRFWCERDGGRYWPWDRTILRIVVGKQEFRVDLALNCWGIGVDLVETDEWSIHLGPLAIECEYETLARLFDGGRCRGECHHEADGAGSDATPVALIGECFDT